jgi:hypothetical protein
VAIRRIDRGKNHSYLIDNQPAIGVTTALSKGLPKPALPYWSAKRVAEHVVDMEPGALTKMLEDYGRNGTTALLKGVPWAERDAAAGKGTEVHKLAEKLIHGEQVDVPEYIAGHVASAVKFMDDWRPRPLLVEPVIASRRWLYAGTADLVAELPDGRRVLFDYKTSRSGIWPETALQLAAYRYADCYLAEDPRDSDIEIPMAEVGITECAAVWVRADGYDVLPLDTGLDVHQAFLHVAYVARVADLMKRWVGPVMYPSTAITEGLTNV